MVTTIDAAHRQDVGVVDETSGERIARQVAQALRDLRGGGVVGVWCQEGPLEGTVYVMASCTRTERPVLEEAVRAAM